jgi:hypothetical protein
MSRSAPLFRAQRARSVRASAAHKHPRLVDLANAEVSARLRSAPRVTKARRFYPIRISATHRCAGVGRAGTSTEIPSGSTRNSGGDPGKGAGGPSSTKQTICRVCDGWFAPSETTKVIPIRFFVISIPILPSCRIALGLDASSPTVSRYHRMDRSRSDTNTTTFGVVGAAVVHGPNSASARRVSVQ